MAAPIIFIGLLVVILVFLLRHFLGQGASYDSYIGTRGHVCDPGLMGSKNGEIICGRRTILAARIAPESGVHVMAEGATVIVTRVEGGVVLVDHVE